MNDYYISLSCICDNLSPPATLWVSVRRIMSYEDGNGNFVPRYVCYLTNRRVKVRLKENH
ncbi:hypothetical protein T4D_10253 [Trichinella pseudospiralis]|uniref:Uncharacterized protein n=1 Tax=Trichinella pseudospiralis TaxID=6337 RepID=A0A0V1DLS7_TRIPS|nr:hypothetical protein T4D_10253 [Trichinella pseudospiralis]